VLDALDKQGLADNTLVLFSSDNGGVNKPNGDTPQNVAQHAGLKPVGPFRGGKHDVWEGGFRVPYLVRWPGHVPAGTVCHETISLVDTLASIASITGATLPKASEGAEDSFDVSSAWLGKATTGPLRSHLIVHSADGNFAIRQGSWKWIEGIPAEDVKPASKKARADQMHPMLYDLQADIVEAHEVSQQHAGVTQELSTLLNRYRDGGFSRELPPLTVKPKPMVTPLPAISNAKPLNLKTFHGNAWSARDEAMFGKADDKGSPLTGNISLRNGVLEFQILLGEANRHSLRVHTRGNQQSFRVVLSQSTLDIAKNPAKGEPADQTVALGRKRVKFASDQWQTLRLTFKDDELTVQFADTTTTVKHPVFAEIKEQANFIAFDGEVGIRQVTIAATE